ncbi:type VI secretion system tube protein Hcp [Phytohabitans sp. LJ34]|uniref:type VI secretion system tube protein Hcp n=1 Tax=Phytohabitans sp. LJ34 TaxID=3452217 RepID=UPI003F88AE5D
MRGWTGGRGVLVSAVVVVVAAGVAVGGVQVANASSAALPAPAAAPIVAALAVPAPGAVQGGIVVDGVTGEGTAIAGGIDVVKFSDVVKSPVTAGGGGAGKPQVADLQVTGVLDAGYPALFRNVTTGRHMRTVALTLCTDAKRCAATAYLGVDLADAVLTHVAVDAGGAVQFFFAFRQITWKFLRNGTVVSQSQFTVA